MSLNFYSFFLFMEKFCLFYNFFSSYFLPVRIIFFFLSQPFWFSSLVENMLYEVLSYEWKQEEDGDGFFFSIINKIYISTLYLNSLQLCIVVSYLAIIINWQISWNFTCLYFSIILFKKKNSICRRKKKKSIIEILDRAVFLWSIFFFKKKLFNFILSKSLSGRSLLMKKIKKK